MSRGVGVQAAQETEFVNVFGRVGEKVGNPCAGLTVLAEGKFGGGDGSAAGGYFLVVFLDGFLVFPGVHLRHRALHEQENDALGLCREMRRFGGQRVLGDLLRDRRR